MTKVSQYILTELLKVFLVTLAGMTLLMLVVGVAQEAIRQGLGPEPILRLIPYVLPNAMRFAIPGTILFAACSVYGRMSASNEVVALKSLGISPMRIITPALILAFLVSLSTVWINDIAVSWGRLGMQRVVLHSVDKIAYSKLRTQRSYSSKQLSITVKRVDGRKLIRPMICFHRPDGQEPVILTAAEAELRLNPAKGVLSIQLTNGEIDLGNGAKVRFPDTIERDVLLTDASRKGGSSTRPSGMPFWKIPEQIANERLRIEQQRQRSAVEAAFFMMSGDIAGLTATNWGEKDLQIHRMEGQLYRLRTEPWRRWATGFSCLFFVMVGAPLAIRLRNSDLWTSFAICFLPILIVYYPLLAYGVDSAKSGSLPPYCVWLGNIILALAGAWNMRRVTRY